MRIDDLFESVQIGLAKKAYRSLSHEARDAIDQWESTNWIGGPLEKHFKANDEVAQEINNAFQPIRDSIPGGKIKLYRGIHNKSENKLPRILESWTSEKPVAEYFAGLRTQQTKSGRSRFINVPSLEDVEKAISQYEAKGYLKMFGHYFLRSKENPKYFNIYDRNKEFLTDGEDIREWLMDYYNDYIERNEKTAKRGRVIEHVFNVNQIVWITNNLNSKEYIVRVA